MTLAYINQTMCAACDELADVILPGDVPACASCATKTNKDSRHADKP
jgi:hypothetical protein